MLIWSICNPHKINSIENNLNCKNYDATELPSLLIFENKKYIGKIDGHYSIDNEENLMKK